MESKHESRIRDICPNLETASVETNDEGLVNDVVIVNGDTIFRFAKHEQAKADLAVEIKVLNLIRSQVPLDVPNPFFTGQDVVAYKKLQGVTFSKQVLTGLDEETKQSVANQLAAFLRVLHNVPLSSFVGGLRPTPAPVKFEDQVAIREKVEEKVYPLLMAHQRAWAQDLYDSILLDPRNFDYEPCLIHGDLGPYHVLFDLQHNRLNGVIDFGVAGVGDAALDIAALLTNYGESFVSKMLLFYPDMEKLMKRARFYAQAIELQWAYLGIETGEAFWFTAHLGSAKDVQ